MVNSTVLSVTLSKTCRLCAVTNGPFFNIFGVDIDLISKIRKLLPIAINEWDELPHKVCYRCAAKITDLYEFSEQCIETQNKFFSTLNKEEQNNGIININVCDKTLSKSNVENVDNKYCDELIKKTVESLPEFKQSKFKELRILLERCDKKVKQQKPSKQSKTNIPIKFIKNMNDAEFSKIENEFQNNNTNQNVPSQANNNIYVPGNNFLYYCKKCNNLFTNTISFNNHICIQSFVSNVNNNISSINSTLLNTKDSLNINNSLKEHNNEKSCSILNNPKNSEYFLIQLHNKNYILAKKPPGLPILTTPVPFNTALKTAVNSENTLKPVKLTDLTETSNETLNKETCKNNKPLSFGFISTPPVCTPLNSSSSIVNSSDTIANTDVILESKNNKNSSHKEKLNDKSNIKTCKKKRKEKSKNDDKPYPVGLFSPKFQKLNIPIKGIKSYTDNIDDAEDNVVCDKKEYKIMANDKSGKIVISTVKKHDSDVSIKDKNVSLKENITSTQNPFSLKKESSNEEKSEFFTIYNISPDSSQIIPTTNTIQESAISTTDKSLISNEFNETVMHDEEFNEMTVHNSNISITIDKNKCKTCNLEFTTQSLYTKHIQTHHKKTLTDDDNKVIIKKRKYS